MLMYFMKRTGSPVELAFQGKYGSITCSTWFGNGLKKKKRTSQFVSWRRKKALAATICFVLFFCFSEGYVVAISSHEKKIGEELHCVRLDYHAVTALVVCSKVQKFAAIVSNIVRVVDLLEWKEDISCIISIPVMEQSNMFGQPWKLEWTCDGQLLTIGTNNGYMATYLVYASDLFTCSSTIIAYISSLQVLTVMDVMTGDKIKWSYVSVEDKREIDKKRAHSYSLLNKRARIYIVAGFNNHIWVYELLPKSSFFVSSESKPEQKDDNMETKLVFEYDYVAEVKEVKINGSDVAVLVDGKVYVTNFESNTINTEHSISYVFPQAVNYVDGGKKKDDGFKIVCMQLTSLFLICSGDQCDVYHLHLSDFKVANETTHESPIRAIFPNQLGTSFSNLCQFIQKYRTVLIDEKNNAYLYNPTNDHKISVPKRTNEMNTFFWDNQAKSADIFYGWDAKDHILHTYVHLPHTYRGPQVQFVDSTIIPTNDIRPIVEKKQTVTGGVLHFARGRAYSAPEWMILNSHDTFYLELKNNVLQIFLFDQIICDLFKQSVAQTPFAKKVLFFAKIMIKKKIFVLVSFNNTRLMNKITKVLPTTIGIESFTVVLCLQNVEIELAVNVFRNLRSASVVLFLENHVLANFEIQSNHYLQSGLCAQLVGDYDLAQHLFLQSNCPIYALRLRKQLLQWEQALELAKRIDSLHCQIPAICRQCAQQLEWKGDYQKALELYNQGLEDENMKVTENKNLGLEHDNNNNKIITESNRLVVEPRQPISAFGLSKDIFFTEIEENEKKKDIVEVRSVEMKGDSARQGASATKGSDKDQENKSLCQAGIIRCTLRIGNIQSGVAMALKKNDKELLKEWYVSSLQSLEFRL
ncbi:hypothetical protein RFI_02828 [Reticulomyxa filosa]|uniref:Uncharacterized protein n=1 Tax=Reticulomyxa filosa TaxID=46433 RepID=X6P865_RETFI|nr:hypothetical protein RFI_02828 [Reticulomyxa filosa]|eukprot:ETO34264.1 hypothetical protein RFI_02828 [Reticulomyxa filosa]